MALPEQAVPPPATATPEVLPWTKAVACTAIQAASRRLCCSPELLSAYHHPCPSVLRCKALALLRGGCPQSLTECSRRQKSRVPAAKQALVRRCMAVSWYAPPSGGATRNCSAQVPVTVRAPEITGAARSQGAGGTVCRPPVVQGGLRHGLNGTVGFAALMRGP